MISAAGKKRIAEAQRNRWAKVHAQHQQKETAHHNGFMSEAIAKVDASISRRKKELETAIQLRDVLVQLAKIA